MDDDLLLLANPHKIRKKNSNKTCSIENDIIRLMNILLSDRGEIITVDIEKFELVYKYLIQNLK